jgi:hypothetical protein
VSKAWDEKGTTINYDSGYECALQDESVLWPDDYVDDGKIRGGSPKDPGSPEKLCWALCPLKLPTIEQVQKCQIPVTGEGAMDPERPGFLPWGDRAEAFDEICLANTIDCPNCDRLLGDLPVGPLKQGKTWALGVANIPVASLYITYKKQYDDYKPKEYLNFGWTGSIFFSFTVRILASSVCQYEYHSSSVCQ